MVPMTISWPSLLLLSLTRISTCLHLPSFNGISQRPLLGSLAPNEKDVLAALTQAEVIPDVLDAFEVVFLINPIYAESNRRVEMGTHLAPEDVKQAPDLELGALPGLAQSETKTRYTLVLSDPDALSHDNPVKSQMCHWIVTNITLPPYDAAQGHAFSLASLTSHPPSVPGVVQLKEYFPPAPPPKTGYHRYVFAFLKSKSDDDSLPKAPEERPHWGYGKVGAGIREWASENDLEVVGANFFYAQNKKQ